MNDEIELIDPTESPAEPEAKVVVAPGWSLLAIAAAVMVGGVLTVVAIDGGGEDASPPVATEPRDDPSVDVTAGVERGDGLVLGRETGFSLVVGGSNTPFRVLDLDTGDLVVSEIFLAPQFVAGSTLIYITDTSTWSMAPLDDLRSIAPDDSNGERFSPAPAQVVPRDSGRVWLTWPRTDGGRDWQLVDLETSDVLRDVTTPAEASVPGGSDPFTGPEVVGSGSGGVFELRSDGGYRRVLDGLVVAVGSREVLVRQCSASRECENLWFDRTSWGRSSRPVPNADLVTGRLVADGRLLAGTVANPPLGSELYDIETGEIVRSLGPAPLSRATVSPDGEWLVRPLNGRIEVVEVATGTSTIVPNLSLGRGDSIIFVPTES